MNNNYMLSDLIHDSIDFLLKYGDMPMMADVLTENQSNLFNVCHGLYRERKYENCENVCLITLDLDKITVSKFKKMIK